MIFVAIFVIAIIVILSILMYFYAYNMVLGLQREWWEGPSTNDLLVIDMTNSSSKP